ncbi:kunitz trypsin inhibitor 5-like [Cornus florida]|uniref:kunitz trypsin inhibitor 5-like n=1 Tax=Cornus florida TaxID=4283 RepID=UPI0028967D52|nr:kunitz trypsin inhibitor 5-like [Cornus florida]
MKTTMVLLSLALLLVLSTNPLLGSAQSDPVLDTAGEELRTGVQYYILPGIRGNGGGLTLSNGNRNGSRCPEDVVQMLNDGNGLPATFTPVTNEGVVRLVTDLNIKFSASTTCGRSHVWSLGNNYDKSVDRSFVSTDGVEGNPGRETLGNWFKIDRYGDGYKLDHCPGVCSICRIRCGELGIFEENGIKRLAKFSEPLQVVFQKV